MNFTEAQKKRLIELIMKGDRNEEENAELVTLKQKATEAGYKYDEKTGQPVQEDEDGLSAEEVKTLVSDSVGKAMSQIGLDEDTVTQIKKSLDETKDAPTAESIQKAVTDALGGNTADPEALAKAIKDNLPGDVLTEEKVKGLLSQFKEDLVEQTRKAARMQFPMDVSAPIEHRGGNLTVGQKQLLNICLMSVRQSALDESNGGRGIARPKSMNDGISEEQLAKAAANGVIVIKSARHEAAYGVKTLTTGGSGTGAELINTDLSSDLQQRLYLESQLAAQMISQELQMPSNPFKFPLATTRTTFYLGTEGTAPSASDPGTADITLDAGKLIGIAQYSYEADEDSIIAILPWLQEMLGKGAAESLEGALVNGDTTATHMDSDIHALGATDHRKIFKGFRKQAIVGTAVTASSIAVDFATGGVSAQNIGALRKAMGIYGVKPGDLMIVCGVKGYSDLIMLDETLTVDKVGPQAARILTGVAPRLYGIPIIPSSAVRENLNATGVYDGATLTKGSVLMVHKPSFILGVRRGFTVETDVDKSAQVNKVIASFRRDLEPTETPSTSLPMVGMGYNYDS